MEERRRTPRASCRLHCRVCRDGDRIRARIVDVSEGGLCLLSQVWLEPKKTVEVAIDVPRQGEVVIQAEVWHARRQQAANSSVKVWVIGMMLAEQTDAYRRLLRAAGLAPQASSSGANQAPPQASPSGANQAPPQGARVSAGSTSGSPKQAPKQEPEDLVDPKIFRVRVKAKSGPRTRLLTLAAESAQEARTLAERDLDSAWTIMDIRAA